MQLCRLIYKSLTSWDLLSNETLLDLAKVSAKNNRELDITGLLVLAGESFLQVLEGPEDSVNALFLKIARDKRHRDVTLLSYEQVSHRSFDDWSMRVLDLGDLPVGARDALLQKFGETDGFPAIPGDAPRAFALLLDAKVYCRSESEDATE